MSISSEEEEKLKREQAKHDKQLLQPLYKRIEELENMIIN